MATVTTYVDSTFSASAIGARTDSSGSAVTDLSAEEARFAVALYTEGAMTTDAFKVSAQTSPTMSVKVGSGVAKADYFLVAGEVAGQGNYVVRLDVTSQNVTIPAADAAQDRIDQVYLVVLDNTYDVTSKSLPRIAHRKGEIGGAAPGADSAWRASALLATIPVPATTTTITNAGIEDERGISRGGGGSGGGSGAGSVAGATVATEEATSSTSFTNLATAGPAVTVEVGSSGVALVTVTSGLAAFLSGSDQEIPTASVALSGANAISASGVGDLISLSVTAPSSIETDLIASRQHLLTGLNPGLTTFTLKYRNATPSGASATFYSREITVVTF